MDAGFVVGPVRSPNQKYKTLNGEQTERAKTLLSTKIKPLRNSSKAA
jgi:hypothetical protein